MYSAETELHTAPAPASAATASTHSHGTQLPLLQAYTALLLRSHTAPAAAAASTQSLLLQGYTAPAPGTHSTCCCERASPAVPLTTKLAAAAIPFIM